jgi:hypothetical protein
MDGCRQFLNENAQKRELKENYGGETLLMKTLTYR